MDTIVEYRNNTPLMEMINSDDAIFHYTKRSTALEIVLSENSFKLFRLLNTNDPREYKDRLLGMSGWGWTTDIDNSIKKVHHYYDDLLRKKSYFSSFSINKYRESGLCSHGYNKPRMWAQYGEDHYGICLVVSKHNFINAIDEHTLNNNYSVFHDIISYNTYEQYSRSRSISIDGDSFNSRTPFQIAFEHIKKYNKELFFTKDPDYRDEDEYRVVVCQSNEKELKELESIEIQTDKIIKGIIVGDRFPKVYKPTVELLCDKLKIEYRKLHWEKREFLLLDAL